MDTPAITVTRINRVQGSGTLKALCDVTIAEAFLIKGVKVVEGKNGVFVSLPREQGNDGQWYDTVIPVTREVRQQLSPIVLTAFGDGQDVLPAA